MGDLTELDRAHGLGMELLETIYEYWELCCELQRGMPADDPRLEDVTRLRVRVMEGLDRADAELVPQLPEFACVHRWPVTVQGFTAASAHQATLEFAGWLKKRLWTTGGFRAFFEKYYDTEKDQIDWDAARAAKDKTGDGLYEFWVRHEWAEHEALLEMEYAKARKLAMNPQAAVAQIECSVEANVLKALGNDVMLGREIAEKAGYKHSYLRDRLPRMVEKGLLEKMRPHGYRKRVDAG